MKVGIGAAALAGLLLSSTALAQDKIKVGVTATLEGTYTILGVDGIAGFNAAVKKYGPQSGRQGAGVRHRLDRRDAGLGRTRRSQAHRAGQGPVLISPLSGDEGIAVKNFSKTHPELTFINAASGAQETTFPDPSPNFFRLNMDGAQWPAGLGDYAYNNKGYKKVATVGEDYSFVYTQVFGLILEFCGLGGPGDEPPVGAARHQGFRLDDRGAARRRRRDLSQPRRRRRGQLPQPVSAGGRQRPISSAARSWSTRPCFRPRATPRKR